MDTNSNKNQPLACDLTAIPASAREEHITTAPQLFEVAQEIQELPTGYAIRFQNEPGRFAAVAKYIENERLCCPFFNFGLEVESNSGAIWLKLTGAEGVKELLYAALLENNPNKNELKKLIHTGGDVHLDDLVAQATLPELAGILSKPATET
jgi:hypothetical protein